MKTIITITIENPSEETLRALLQGSAEKQSAVIKTKFKAEKAKSNSLKGKKPVTHEKICVVCGKKFKPNSNRQVRCSKDCKKQPLEPIEDTLKEIELRRTERNNKPYEFAN